MNEYFVIILLMTFFAAGVVKGLTGMGLPTVAIGILSLFIALPAAAAMIIIPSFATNFWQLFTGPSISRLLKKLWPLVFCIIPGTFVGSFAQVSARPMRLDIGHAIESILEKQVIHF